jgi:4'-phosphopantetheinyl transferase
VFGSLHISPLVEGVIQVWRTRAEAAAGSELGETLWSLLTDEEFERAKRYVFPANRQEFVAGRALVRLVLGRTLDIPPGEVAFRRGPFGKPELDRRQSAARIHFNVSHSAGLVVAAFSLQCEVGVDVEPASRVISPSVQRRVFTPRELRSWQLLPLGQQREAATARWTLKEAYLKARGDGLNLPLLDFEFDELQGQPRIRFSASIDDDPRRWRFQRLRVARHLLAVAQRDCGSPAGLELHELVSHAGVETRHERTLEPCGVID